MVSLLLLLSAASSTALSIPPRLIRGENIVAVPIGFSAETQRLLLESFRYAEEPPKVWTLVREDARLQQVRTVLDADSIGYRITTNVDGHRVLEIECLWDRPEKTYPAEIAVQPKAVPCWTEAFATRSGARR